MAQIPLGSSRLDTTRHVRLCRTSRASRDEHVERVEPYCSNMADDEEAAVLACTSFIVCALCVQVNGKEKRQHALWVNDYLKKERLLDVLIRC